ncbi:12725_t:CDS:2 [Dentiscutata heterogama]|uniref:12725_t:CDS:1 n=1 Tax=Dentiscutata heterogama TaxID=1316150 RepID=A0ACA9K690_9GLOM|nr:12725_t:CDS:2 [Dentiscutata heterogama]
MDVYGLKRFLKNNGSKDYNRIRALPSKSKIVKSLQKYKDVITKYIGSEYVGSLLKWEVSNERVIQALLKEFNSDTWESIDCVKLNYKFICKRFENGKLIDDTTNIIIYKCDLLNNEDLVMITSAGLFIWSIWQKYKKIRLRYYMHWRGFGCIINYEGNLLPAPDFDFLIINNKQSYMEDNRYIFEELMNDYIDDNILMKLYGKDFLIATINGLSNYTQNLLLIATIILGFLHLIFEIRQFIYSPLFWIFDIWNYFGAILFPVLTSIDWLQFSTTSIWAVTISILLLELKFITFFRAIEFSGTHWAMVIDQQLMQVI